MESLVPRSTRRSRFASGAPAAQRSLLPGRARFRPARRGDSSRNTDDGVSGVADVLILLTAAELAALQHRVDTVVTGEIPGGAVAAAVTIGALLAGREHARGATPTSGKPRSGTVMCTLLTAAVVGWRAGCGDSDSSRGAATPVDPEVPQSPPLPVAADAAAFAAARAAAAARVAALLRPRRRDDVCRLCPHPRRQPRGRGRAVRRGKTPRPNAKPVAPLHLRQRTHGCSHRRCNNPCGVACPGRQSPQLPATLLLPAVMALATRGATWSLHGATVRGNSVWNRLCAGYLKCFTTSSLRLEA